MRSCSFLVFASFLLVAAVSSQRADSEAEVAVGADGEATPVETKKARTDYMAMLTERADEVFSVSTSSAGELLVNGEGLDGMVIEAELGKRYRFVYEGEQGHNFAMLKDRGSSQSFDEVLQKYSTHYDAGAEVGNPGVQSWVNHFMANSGEKGRFVVDVVIPKDDEDTPSELHFGRIVMDNRYLGRLDGAHGVFQIGKKSEGQRRTSRL